MDQQHTSFTAASVFGFLSQTCGRSLAFAALVILSGCVTRPSVQVIERADNLSEAPSWTSFTNVQAADNGAVNFLGYMEVNGDAQISAAFNMSDEKAMSEPLRSLVDAFLDQNQVGEEYGADSTFGRRIISVTSGYRPAMPSLHIATRYYELVVVHSGIAADQLKLRVWSRAVTSLPDFDHAKKQYSRRLAGEPEIRRMLNEIGKKQIQKVNAVKDRSVAEAPAAPVEVVQTPVSIPTSVVATPALDADEEP
jgi:hypothetical protein